MYGPGGGNAGLHHRGSSSGGGSSAGYIDASALFGFTPQQQQQQSMDTTGHQNMHHHQRGSSSGSYGMNDNYSNTNAPFNPYVNTSSNTPYNYNSPAQSSKSLGGGGGSVAPNSGSGNLGRQSSSSSSNYVNSPAPPPAGSLGMQRNSSLGSQGSIGSIGQRLNNTSGGGGGGGGYNSMPSYNTGSNNYPASNDQQWNTPKSTYRSSSGNYSMDQNETYGTNPPIGMLHSGHNNGSSGNLAAMHASAPQPSHHPAGHPPPATSLSKKKSAASSSAAAGGSTVAPTEPAEPEPKPQRVDLKQRKGALEQVLGSPSQQQQYWTLIEKYLLVKLSRAELESGVLDILGPAHIHLHNEFILGILQNAYSEELPPKISLGARKKTSTTNVLGADGTKKEGSTKAKKEKSITGVAGSTTGQTKKERKAAASGLSLSPESAARKKLEAKERKAARKKRKEEEEAAGISNGTTTKRKTSTKKKSTGAKIRPEDEDISTVSLWLSQAGWFRGIQHQPMAHIKDAKTYLHALEQYASRGGGRDGNLGLEYGQGGGRDGVLGGKWNTHQQVSVPPPQPPPPSAIAGAPAANGTLIPSASTPRAIQPSISGTLTTATTPTAQAPLQAQGTTVHALTPLLHSPSQLQSQSQSHQQSSSQNLPPLLSILRPTLEHLHPQTKLSFSAANTGTIAHAQGVLRELYQPRRVRALSLSLSKTEGKEDDASATLVHPRSAPASRMALASHLASASSTGNAAAISSILPINYSSAYQTHWDAEFAKEAEFDSTGRSRSASGSAGKRRVRDWDMDSTEDGDRDDADEYLSFDRARSFSQSSFDDGDDEDDVDEYDEDPDDDGTSAYAHLADPQTQQFFQSVRSQPLPDRELIRKRLYQSALSTGIRHVSEAAVTMLQQATEAHLKTIISSILDFARPRTKGQVGAAAQACVPVLPEQPMHVSASPPTIAPTVTTHSPPVPSHPPLLNISASTTGPILALPATPGAIPTGDIMLIPSSASSANGGVVGAAAAAAVAGGMPTLERFPPSSHPSAHHHGPRTLSVLIPSSPSLGPQPQSASLALVLDGSFTPLANMVTPAHVDPMEISATVPASEEERSSILTRAWSKHPGKEYTHFHPKEVHTLGRASGHIHGQPPQFVPFTYLDESTTLPPPPFGAVKTKDDSYTLIPPPAPIREPINAAELLPHVTPNLAWQPTGWKQADHPSLLFREKITANS